MTKPSAGSRRLVRVRHLLRPVPIGLALILAACSAAPAATPSAEPSLSVASPAPTVQASAKPDPAADFSGAFSYDDIEGGCPYLQTADGRKLEVIYPDGWSVRNAPLKLIAPDGSVHSRAGDIVSIRGAEATDMASICQIGPIIRATEVLDR
jgi:hypothetical protein